MEKAADGWRQKEDSCHWQCVSAGEKGTDSQGGHVARTPVQSLENVRADRKLCLLAERSFPVTSSIFKD